MEERKRKAPLVINWSEVHEDDESPPEVEIVAVEESSLKTLSDSELKARIASMKCTTAPTVIQNLPDCGVKLLNKLKALEAEFDRRSKLPKKNVTPVPAKSAYARSTDGFFARGATNRQSEFACNFGNRLDDKKANDKGSVFQDEIQALRPCKTNKRVCTLLEQTKQKANDKDNPFLDGIRAIRPCKTNKRVNPHVSPKSDQKTNSESDSAYFTLSRSNHTKRANPQFSTKKTGGVSSTKSSFETPRHTSKNMDNDRLSSGRQSRCQFSNPFPARTRDQSPVSWRSCAPHFQAPRSSRQNNKTFVHLEEEDSESEATVPTDKLDESMKDTVISYPSRDASDAVEINYSDVECLDPKQYLSSTIMNFYIMYLQITSTKRQDYLFLNTYFYKKLTQDVLKKSDRESSFIKLRRWWKGVNIFEKAYVFLPVHESLHWSLIIICIPDKEDESGPIILHLDSLGMHNSKSICRDVKSFLIEEWKVMRQEDAVPKLPIAEKVWDNLSKNIEDRVIEVPQQGNEFDCGIFVLFFMERFIDEAPRRLKTKDLVKFGKRWFKPGEASSLRRRIRKLLIEEFKNANRVSIDLDP